MLDGALDDDPEHVDDVLYVNVCVVHVFEPEHETSATQPEYVEETSDSQMIIILPDVAVYVSGDDEVNPYPFIVAKSVERLPSYMYNLSELKSAPNSVIVIVTGLHDSNVYV